MKSIPASIRAAACAAALFLSGCMSQNFESGTQMSSDKIAQIKKGVTTRAQVETLLGPPAHVQIMPEGKRTLMYTYTSTKTDAHAKATAYIPYVGMFAGGGAAQNQVHTQSLQVVIGSAGIVEDYEFSDDTTKSTAETGGLMGMSSTGSSTTTGSAVSASDGDKK